jgi:hypothetical protein
VPVLAIVTHNELPKVNLIAKFTFIFIFSRIFATIFAKSFSPFVPETLLK